MNVYQPIIYYPLRGGSWSTQPRYARASYRLRFEPSNRYENDGFLCALIVWRHQ